MADTLFFPSCISCAGTSVLLTFFFINWKASSVFQNNDNINNNIEIFSYT